MSCLIIHGSCRQEFQTPSLVNTKGTTSLIKILLGYIVLYWYKIVSVFIVNLERVIYTCAVWLIGNVTNRFKQIYRHSTFYNLQTFVFPAN